MTARPRLGRYRLVRRLAVGGMAEVYLAVAEGLSGFEKRMVVKRLLPQYARDPERVAMFLDEARLVATLKHPHIAEVYDVGAEDNDYYFVMEHVAGRDLRDLLIAGMGEPLPQAEALAIVMAVADGLHYAHEHRSETGTPLGIIHRDVSPSNVLVSAVGEVKLIDFGVAKWAAQRTETQHGMLKGKCAYMSPEQCRAEPLDRRSDLFSLGVLLYEVTTGQRPFDGESDFETMTAIVRGQPLPPSARRTGYPAALEEIVMRALAPRREDRYSTSRALADDLSQLTTAQPPARSAAALAARLRAMFGDEAAGQRPPEEEEPPRPPVGAIPEHTPRTSKERPVAAHLAFTATDHVGGLQLGLAGEGTLSHTAAAVSPEARRIGIFAGIGLLAVAALLAVSSARRPHGPTAIREEGRALLPPARVVEPAPVPAPAPALARPRPSPALGRGKAPVLTPAPGRPVRQPRNPARRSARPAAGPPTVTIWDPDSPLPPP